MSLTDKAGAVEFAYGLSSFGVEIVSTGGTAKLLREADVKVRDVSDVTGFPEMLDGRVKTIHPRIAGGVLAIRNNPAHMEALVAHDIQPIDMVVVNLYAFEKTAAKHGVTVPELIESIDIGGPTLIRAAAKNWQDVAVVVDPADYAGILEEILTQNGSLTLETKWRLAQKAFALTAAYDRAISQRLSRIAYAESAFIEEPPAALPQVLDIRLPLALPLRYGENSHQAAALYSHRQSGIAGAKQLSGKEMSYNNFVDADAAWQLVHECRWLACAIVKHTNPCGCAEADTQLEAYRKALECDPVSAFGGVVAFNLEVDWETANELAKLFVEVVAAPSYSDEALAILKTKKNLRILQVPNNPADLVVKSISGGFLVQTPDRTALDDEVDKATVVTTRPPTPEELKALKFAWRVAKHVKSNAIVYARAGQLHGVGAGQMNRVNSARIGAAQAVLPLTGCVVGSDAFFPFADGVEEVIRNGATAIVQPGGSKNDQLAIDAANKAGIAMLFTGVRHFRH